MLSLAPLALVAAAIVPCPLADDGDALFRDTVRPILEARCFECHGTSLKRVKGGLRFSDRDALLKGGRTGPAIVAGKPDESLLVKAVRRTDDELAMPPDAPLSADEVDAIERWIALGAPWPDAATGEPRPDAPASAIPAEAPPDREAVAFFEREVRPLLAEHCFDCHGQATAKFKGGLRMTGHAALLRGGDSGPAIAPGDADSSRLVRAVRWTDPDLRMPPSRKLSDAQIATLEQWVTLGAPWPDDVAPGAPREIDVDGGREWWSFKPVVKPAVPALATASDVNPIDAFIRARLAAERLPSAPEADRRTLARRLWFDVIGLPPTIEEIDRFAGDAAPDAFERQVDALLARPEYGERWARHWLDVVRYAETNGYERDAPKPRAWRYRDWVIDALNADMPFDRFAKEQIAGDEMPGATDGSVIATGFYRLGVWDSEPDDKHQARYDELDDIVRTIGEGFLGVTINCARCHDHKFDPFPQKDYYGLLAFVANVTPYADEKFDPDSPTLALLDATGGAAQRWKKERTAAKRKLDEQIRAKSDVLRTAVLEKKLTNNPRLRAVLDVPAAKRTPEQRALGKRLDAIQVTNEEMIDAVGLEETKSLKRLKDQQTILEQSFPGSFDWALAAKEIGSLPAPVHLLVRGQADSPGEAVEPHFPLVLGPPDAPPPALPEIDRDRATLGRRRVLADWIASEHNPLTARVIVNRVWQHHFGRGIVPTPNDFGRAGEPPSHPELLDWLAADFVANGWSLKRLHRMILTSATWRQSSSFASQDAIEKDPDDRLLWRQNPRRLEAEALRDSILAASGTLVVKRGGESFYEPLPRAVLAGSSRPGDGYGVSTPEESSRRSVYGYVKRNLPNAFLEAFDYTNTTLPEAQRSVTTVASQALVLLNGEFAGREARAFAERVATEAGDDPSRQVDRAFERAFGRRPSDDERRVALEFLERSTAGFAKAEPAVAFDALVPNRIETGFLHDLDGAHVLRAPTHGFTVLRGRYGNDYNQTQEVDPLDGPAALWDGAEFGDGEVRARMRLVADAPFGSLLLRANADGDVAGGLEVRLEPGVAILLEHDSKGPREVARAAAPVAADAWIEVRVTLAGPKVEVRLEGAGDAPLLAFDGAPAQPGRAGIRTFGAGVEVARLEVTTSGRTSALPIDGDPPARQALAALALALLNLNEFAWID